MFWKPILYKQMQEKGGITLLLLVFSLVNMEELCYTTKLKDYV